ncbi:MAG: hypothetical protein KCHDKBKB_00599 [Elusimicrobia bacterium]|nr:hypothetical protein [Elusimicrobiota bacterium]
MPGQYIVTIDGAEQVVKDLLHMSSRLGMDSENMLDGLAQEARMMLSANAPRTQGYLADSMDVIYSNRGERWIGAGESGPSSEFPPSHYIDYVEQGGGPTTTMPNVEDIMARFGLDLRQAIVFSRYLQTSGKAVRQASGFVRRTADQIQSNYLSSVQRMLDRIIL